MSGHFLIKSNLSPPSVCSHHKVQANNRVQSVALHHSSGMDMARFTDYGLFTHFFVVSLPVNGFRKCRDVKQSGRVCGGEM